jgi:VWFA-related protein
MQFRQFESDHKIVPMILVCTQRPTAKSRAAVKNREASLANLSSREIRCRSKRSPSARVAVFIATLAMCGPGRLGAQSPNSSPPAPPQTEPPTVIRVQTNLVLVRVVVRDGHGNAVAGLGQADFQVFDNGKPQAITFFSAEKSATQPGTSGRPATEKSGAPPTGAPGAESGPQYTALFFDDFHLQFEDLVRTRNAAKGFLKKALSAGDRVGIFTASGKVELDFTTDADKLQKAIAQLRTQGSPPGGECPPLPPYLAQQVLDGDPDSIKIARIMTRACVCPQGNCPPDSVLDADARAAAQRILDQNDVSAQDTLAALQKLVRYIGKFPGEHRIGLVSDGFQNRTHQDWMSRIIDGAIRSNVIINALDAQGLTVENRKLEEKLNPDTGVIEDAAQGTGGVFVEDTNDYDGAFERIGGVAEVSYVLGFAPDGLKFDGRFHKLKTIVTAHSNWNVQARSGYFATPLEAPAASPDLQPEARLKAIVATTDADEKIRLCQDFLRNYPTGRFAESVSNRLVEAYYLKRDWNNFYAAAGTVLARDPDDIDVLVLTGWVIPRLYDPNDSGAAAKLAQAESNLKRAMRLILALPKPVGLTDEQFATDKASEMSRIQSGLGLVDFRRGNYGISVHELQRATTDVASPDPTDLWAMGIGLQQLKRYPEAAEAFEKCGQIPGELQDRCKQLKYLAKDEKAKLHQRLWSPPDVDTTVGSLSNAQACSLPDVLAGAGKRAQELVADLQRFAAHEKVQIEELDASGMVNRSELINYDYVVSFQEHAGALLISESRYVAGREKGLAGGPPDEGLPSLALILHPYYRGDYDMRCEGMGDWEGIPTWVIHFVQRKDKPSRMSAISTPQGAVPMNLKGRAWIAADSHQVLHIETNLTEPLLMQGIYSYAMSISYGPVEFHSQKVQLWLPLSAESYTDHATTRSVVKHTFADFLLFSVQSNQTVDQPH